MQGSSGKHTRMGDLPSDLHESIEHVFDCRLAISEVVCSSDGYQRIRSHVRGETDTRQGRIGGDVPGRDVVLVTSRDRDVVSLSGLQNDSYNLINVGVHIQAPRGREVQNTGQPAYREVSCRAPGR